MHCNSDLLNLRRSTYSIISAYRQIKKEWALKSRGYKNYKIANLGQ